MESEGCFGIFSLPDDSDDRHHHSPSLWTPSRRKDRRNEGGLLAIYGSRSGPHHDCTRRLPPILRCSQQRQTSALTQNMAAVELQGQAAFPSPLKPSTWRMKNLSRSSCSGEFRSHDNIDLPAVPRGTMTGVRTFIEGQGRTKVGTSRLMNSNVDGREDGRWPLSSKI